MPSRLLATSKPSGLNSIDVTPIWFAELIKRGRPIDFLLLNAAMVPGKKRVLTAAAIKVRGVLTAL